MFVCTMAMERSLSSQDLNVFKVPYVPQRKKAKIVLEEEEYLNEMGKIIERDFFPDLKIVRAQNQYLDAVIENNTEKMQMIHSRYSGSLPTHQHCSSPATFETPITREREQTSVPAKIVSSNENKQKSVFKKLSLDQYVEHCTSEDNVNFSDLIEESENKHKERVYWMYRDEDALNNLERRLVVPSIDEQAAGVHKPKEIETWSYKNKNQLMFPPSGVEFTDAEKLERLKKKSTIVHVNTNLREIPFDEKKSQSVIRELAQNQTESLEGKIGLDGKVLTFPDKKMEKYSYVRTPSPMPGVDASPLMTWGEIEGTPFRLDGSDTPRISSGPTFHMQQVPKRERIALALADKVTESHRDKKRKAAAAAKAHRRPTTPSRSALFGSMSPAAQRLASSTIGKRLNTDLSLQSPSPARTSCKSFGSTTPSRLTDNLLNIVTKRPPI